MVAGAGAGVGAGSRVDAAGPGAAGRVAGAVGLAAGVAGLVVWVGVAGFAVSVDVWARRATGSSKTNGPVIRMNQEYQEPWGYRNVRGRPCASRRNAVMASTATSATPYTGLMPLARTLPADLADRLDGIGQVIVAAVPDVDFAYLFGSIALDRRTPQSDVDLAIHLAGTCDPHAARLDVARAAGRHLGTDAIDVVVLNHAPIALAGRVLTSRRVVVDRVPFVRHRYESLTARMFQDFRVREHRMLAARYPHG